MSPAPSSLPRYDVIYDGDCGICEACRSYGEAMDWMGLFRWRSNADESVLADHPHLTREALDGALHVIGGGRTLAGFDAVRFLAVRMPLASIAGALMYLPGAAIPGNAVYRWVATHRKTVLACRIGEPTIVHKALANVFIVAVLAVAAAGSFARTEDWPLTCAPMFATPVEEDGARYSFRFVGIDEKGREREIPSAACGIPELRLKRIFFARYYGSVDPDYEHGAVPADTPAAFEKRMAGFFRAFCDEAREQGDLDARFRQVRLDVVREAGNAVEKHAAGLYDTATREFRRLP